MVTSDTGWVKDELGGMTRKVVLFNKIEIIMDVGKKGDWVIFEGRVGTNRRTWAEKGKAKDGVEVAKAVVETRMSWRVERYQVLQANQEGWRAARQASHTWQHRNG